MSAKQTKVPMLDVHTVSFMLALRNPSSDTELETNCYLLEALDDLLGFHMSDLLQEVQNIRKQKRGRLSVPGSKAFKQNLRRYLATKICGSLRIVHLLSKEDRQCVATTSRHTTRNGTRSDIVAWLSANGISNDAIERICRSNTDRTNQQQKQ